MQKKKKNKKPAYDKIQHHFMIKILHKLGIEGMHHNKKALYWAQKGPRLM
jgi:hypothetical protein